MSEPSNNQLGNPVFGEVMSTYSRGQAIEDGVLVDGRATEAELITLKLMVGAGDSREPVLTILLPNED